MIRHLIVMAIVLTPWWAASTTMAGPPTPLTTVRVASGLNRPVFATAAPDDFVRLFIVEKRGVIRILNLNTGVVNATNFLNIDALVGGGTSNGDERGLLGMAFHPDYGINGFFYVYYTNNSNNTVVARYTVSANPDVANAGSAQTVITHTQPQTNHNGGWLGFGPDDGFLYIALGDGGGGGDDDAGHTPGVGNGQDLTNNLLGKMLRVDVNGDDFPADPNRNYAIPESNPFVNHPFITGDHEIWAFGLRNPWRNAFDRETGDLYIADVGQGAWEEINWQKAGIRGGQNYGWRCREGMHPFNPNGDCTQTPFIEPIHEYSHGSGCSITGGYPYRGCAIDDLQGTYFFADYCSARIWSFAYVGSTVTNFQERTGELAPGGGLSISSIVSFGEDAYGEMYIVEQCSTTCGEIYKIVAAAPLDNDCNSNGVEDRCDILDESSPDTNTNGIPDECEAAPPTPTGWKSRALHDPLGDQGAPTLWDLVIAVAARGGPSDPRADTQIEPRYFNLPDPPGGTSTTQKFLQIVIDLDGAATAAVTVDAVCTDATVHLAAVTLSAADTVVTAVFDPPLPNTECCTLTLQGGAGGNQVIKMLAADVDGSGRVNATDKFLVKGNQGDPPLPADKFFFDVNMSGRINATDKNMVKASVTTNQNELDPACP